jgi:hypothetical protein
MAEATVSTKIHNMQAGKYSLVVAVKDAAGVEVDSPAVTVVVPAIVGGIVVDAPVVVVETPAPPKPA